MFSLTSNLTLRAVKPFKVSPISYIFNGSTFSYSNSMQFKLQSKASNPSKLVSPNEMSISRAINQRSYDNAILSKHIQLSYSGGRYSNPCFPEILNEQKTLNVKKIIPKLGVPVTLQIPSWFETNKSFGPLSFLSRCCFYSSFSSMANEKKEVEISYLNQDEAQKVDEELMSTLAFSIDQLMELAGLSVAAAVEKVSKPSKVLIICGPGNNGGDGLVAARHLKHFGYEVTVVYPKRSKKTLFQNLIIQCETLGIEIENSLPDKLEAFNVILDGIFGFSFKPPSRPPFDDILKKIMDEKRLRKDLKIVSIDVPSGWDVMEGDNQNTGFEPDVLVSLTAPKKCAEKFKGDHYLGGRFVPPAIKDKYNLILPMYKGAEQITLISESKL